MCWDPGGAIEMTRIEKCSAAQGQDRDVRMLANIERVTKEHGDQCAKMEMVWIEP